MSEQIQEVTETPTPKPVKRKAKAKKRTAPKAEKAADAPIKGGKYAGISASTCPAACTAEHCVISTVGVCKHPYKSAPNGCGPITLKNREEALKLIKHQMIDLQG